MKKLLAALLMGAFAIAPVAAAVASEPAAAVAEAAAVEATLKDGTKIEIVGDAVSVVGADGTKTPAPDGEHELSDGTKVTTKDGKKAH